GDECANVLRESWMNAEQTRNLHLHAGDLLGEEFQSTDWIFGFTDTSFMHANDALYKIVAATVVEWLDRGGNYVPAMPKKRVRRGSAVFRRVAVGAALFAAGVLAGTML